jgi:hypothetical protein
MKTNKTKDHPSEYDQLMEGLADSVAKGLDLKNWHTGESLWGQIDNSELSPVQAAVDLDVATQGPAAVKDRIKADVVAHLVATGRCEVRGEGPAAELRLLPPQDTGHPTNGEPAARGPVAGPGKGWQLLPAPILVKIADLKPHPKQHLVPAMPPEQRKRFFDDVAQQGVSVPIVITKDNVIVDGHTRKEAAVANGQETIPAIVVDLDEAQQEVHMLQAALRRRHLTADQLAMLEVKLRERDGAGMRQEQARKAGRAGGRGRPKTPDSSLHTVCSELSGSRAGDEVGTGGATPAQPPPAVPKRKQRAARKINKASPETGDRVASGELSIDGAKRELRGKGLLPPPKSPKFSPAAEAARAADPLAAASPGGVPPAHGLPIDSGAALADALVGALGVDGALARLREAVRLVEARRDRPAALGAAGANGAPDGEAAGPRTPAEAVGGEAVTRPEGAGVVAPVG